MSNLVPSTKIPLVSLGKTPIKCFLDILTGLNYEYDYIQKHVSLFQDAIGHIELNEYIKILCELGIITPGTVDSKPVTPETALDLTNLENVRTEANRIRKAVTERAKNLKKARDDYVEKQASKDCEDIIDEARNHFSRYFHILNTLSVEKEQLETNRSNEKKNKTDTLKRLEQNDFPIFVRYYACLISLFGKNHKYHDKISKYDSIKELQTELDNFDQKTTESINEIYERIYNVINKLDNKYNRCFEATEYKIQSQLTSLNQELSKFICPIALSIINEPISIFKENPNGTKIEYVFEKDYIQKSLQKKKENPLTRDTVSNGRPNNITKEFSYVGNTSDEFVRQLKEFKDEVSAEFNKGIFKDEYVAIIETNKNLRNNKNKENTDKFLETLPVSKPKTNKTVQNIEKKIENTIFPKQLLKYKDYFLNEISKNYYMKDTKEYMAALSLLREIIELFNAGKEHDKIIEYKTGVHGFFYKTIDKIKEYDIRKKLKIALTMVSQNPNINQANVAYGGKRKTRRQKSHTIKRKIKYKRKTKYKRKKRKTHHK